jgi:hypothetical protein
MALSFNEKMSSPYYPRRARWYSRFFYLGLATRHRLALDRIRLPKEITLAGLILGFLIPGLAVYIRGPRLLGRMALSACALLFLSFIVWLGYPIGNYAFGLMLSIHVSGFVYYCTVMRNEDFWHRILFTLAILLGLGLFLYAPMRGVIQSRWLTPLRENGHVIVVQKNASPGGVRRGDWVMYSLPNLSTGNAHGEGGAVRVQAGFGWGLVLAVAGDRVAFSTNSFSVDGVERPLLPHMPTSGNLVVREKSWFVWPELDISGHGNTSEANISATMLRLATVPEGQFVGKPFKRWFWRKQILQ